MSSVLRTLDSKVRAVRQIAALVVSPALGTATWAQDIAQPSTRRGEAFYTEDQATRGRYAFNRNCAFCHSMDPSLSTPEDLMFALPRTFAGHFLERVVEGKMVYPSVFYLYSKLESMPAFDTQAVTAQTRADIAAYILQANGLPGGSRPLRPDPEAMKTMMLNEPGFERIFNGKDFTGIGFSLGPNCQPEPLGCGMTDPDGVVWIDNGTIVCGCNVHGIWYTEKRYGDFTLRFDFKFDRPAYGGATDDEVVYVKLCNFRFMAEGVIG